MSSLQIFHHKNMERRHLPLIQSGPLASSVVFVDKEPVAHSGD